jgi:cytochrome c556
MLHKIGACAVLCGLAVASVALAQSDLPIKDQMKTVVDPASNVVFAVGGEADPANDPKPHLTDARWAEAADAAQKLKAVAAGLADPDRAKDQGAWLTDVKQFSDLADAALKAAKAKDGAALSTAANNLGDACTTCHAVYKPKTAS